MVKTKGICESVVSLFVNLYSMNQLTYLSIQPCTYPLIHLPTHLPTHSCTHLTTYLSTPVIHTDIHTFIHHPSIHSSTHLPTNLPTYSSIHLPVHPLTHPPNRPYANVSFVIQPLASLIHIIHQSTRSPSIINIEITNWCRISFYH